MWLHHCPGQPLPMHDNPSCVEIFPSIQSKSLLVILEDISSCLVTCHLGEEPNPYLAAPSCQGGVESNRAHLSLLFSGWASQLPQLLIIRLMIQTLPQLFSGSAAAPQCLPFHAGPKTEHRDVKVKFQSSLRSFTSVLCSSVSHVAKEKLTEPFIKYYTLLTNYSILLFMHIPKILL